MSVEFWKGNMDGDTDPDMDDCVYLHVWVVIDGDREGSLTGWYAPAVAQQIKAKLGVNEKRA